MTKTNSGALIAFLLAVLAVMGGVALAKGGLYIGKHEGDAMHLLEIVFRMADGQWPHLDFVTPIGVLAFAPIAWLVDMGLGVGHAILWSQIMVGALLIPATWWVASSRLSGIWPYIFGLIIVVLATALVHGEAQRSVSISMHYNRWAWAVAFLVIAAGALPPVQRRSALADGLVIGLGLAVLALMKVTYFAAFVIPVALGLLARKEFKTFGIGLLAGLVVAGLVTVLAGPSFWLAYLGDMLAVAGSEVRPQPGEPLTAVVAAPAYLGGSLVLLLGVILLRQGKKDTEGLVLLLLVPGFFYVTFQNFGNDPQWLLLLGVLLFAARPAEDVVNGNGWNMRNAVGMAGAAAFALSLPSAFNLTFSPFRHLSAQEEKYTAVLPRADLHADLKTGIIRAHRVDGRLPLDGPGSGLEAYADKGERDPQAELNGEVLPRCELELGMSAWFDTVAQSLEAEGHAGKRIMAADLFSSFALFGDFKMLEGGAPWYYGGLPGFETAELVLVPLCPITPKVRKQILVTIVERGVTLKEVSRTPLYILLEKG